MAVEVTSVMARAFESGKLTLADQLRALADAIDQEIVTARLVQVEKFANRFPGINIIIEVRPKP